MHIKICGLKRPEDVGYVNEFRPEWGGFVFAGHKRKISHETAARLRSQLHPSIRAVGVFVNEDVEAIARMVADHTIDMVQLHGDEDAAYIASLRQALAAAGCQAPCIKAVRVRDTAQILALEQLPVEYLLLDAFRQDEYGGSGMVFDHSLIPHLSKPYFVAGGIDCANAPGIVATLRSRGLPLPCGFDVSSSVETDRVKDREKIRDIITLVHTL